MNFRNPSCSMSFQEYKVMRGRYPDLFCFFVERSELDSDDTCIFSDERCLIQIESKGFYMKISSLKRCIFFEKMFSHVVKETVSGRCHLQSNAYLFPEKAFAAVMEFISNRSVNYLNYGWINSLLASDYLGIEEMKNDIDADIVKYEPTLDFETAIFLLHKIEIQIGWVLPKTASVCVEIIKSNLHFLVLEKTPHKLIGSLSRATVVSILTDPRLTYFTMIERQLLLWKWVSRGESSKEVQERQTLFRFINYSDDACSTIPLPMKSHKCIKDKRFRNDRQICLKHLKPIIFIAGGTGDGVKHSDHGQFSRPTIPSKSLIAYSIEGNSWTTLPDLPIPMLKPLVASNSMDEIYVIDSHGFRDQDLIKTHYFFSLKFNFSGWYWKSLSFQLPCGIRNFQLTHLFCVESKVYLLGIAKVFDQIMNDWKKGPQHRKLLLETLESSVSEGENEKLWVSLMTLDLRDGTVDLIRFLFIMDMDSQRTLNACIVGTNLCMATSPDLSLYDDANRDTQIFAVFNCSDGNVFCETGPVIPTDYDLLVPNPDGTGVLAVTMDGCCYRAYYFGESCSMEVRNKVLPPPHSCLSGTIRRSYTMLAHENKLYYIGGWTVQGRKGLATCMAFTIPHKNKGPRWDSIAALPYPVVHAGATLCYFPQQSVSHHINCPHCKIYPQDVFFADVSRVNVQPEYVANLMSAYPPDGVF